MRWLDRGVTFEAETSFQGLIERRRQDDIAGVRQVRDKERQRAEREQREWVGTVPRPEPPNPDDTPGASRAPKNTTRPAQYVKFFPRKYGTRRAPGYVADPLRYLAPLYVCAESQQ